MRFQIRPFCRVFLAFVVAWGLGCLIRANEVYGVGPLSSSGVLIANSAAPAAFDGPPNPFASKSQPVTGMCDTGTMSISAGGYLGEGSGATTINAGTLELGSGITTLGFGSGGLQGELGATSLVVGNQSGFLTLSGDIIMNGSNTYTGSTTVSGGTLTFFNGGSSTLSPGSSGNANSKGEASSTASKAKSSVSPSAFRAAPVALGPWPISVKVGTEPTTASFSGGAVNTYSGGTVEGGTL